jgi:hypothetical protein
VQAPKSKWYLHKGYHKKLDSFEITKSKGSYISVLTFIKKDHHQLDANFIANINLL